MITGFPEQPSGLIGTEAPFDLVDIWNPPVGLYQVELARLGIQHVGHREVDPHVASWRCAGECAQPVHELQSFGEVDVVAEEVFVPEFKVVDGGSVKRGSHLIETGRHLAELALDLHEADRLEVEAPDSLSLLFGIPPPDARLPRYLSRNNALEAVSPVQEDNLRIFV